MKTFLKAYWKDIVMINYEVPKELLLPYLPYGVELDDFEGKYFVSLVGFQFLNTSIFGIKIPFYGSFEEVNLRFYVKRKFSNEIKRGVVFISEIVPYRLVAFLANKLYKEHYNTKKMQCEINVANDIKKIIYSWYDKDKRFVIQSDYYNHAVSIVDGSHEYFIYEHYYGYTKLNDNETWEYKVYHPRWQTNHNCSCSVDCDFALVYGESFSFFQNQKPHSVYNAWF